jgi:hypothetical protein
MVRINVNHVYPELESNGCYNEVCDYEPMVNAFGRRVLVAVDVNDYQGDSYRLIADGDEPDQRYGLLIFGWGSCSGCDALQWCDSVEELQELADQLQSSIKWFSDKETLRKYMQEHDWEGDWSWHEKESHDFRRKVMEFLDSDRL